MSMVKEGMIPQKSEETRLAEAPKERILTPPVDILEYKDGLEVWADLPGVMKEDVEVNIENDVLTIGGKCKLGTIGEPLYREFELTKYFRQFQLTERVDQQKINAELKQGVLVIKLPKSEKAMPKKIAVNVG